VRTPRGEAASEFATGDGTVIVDEDVYHQYYFLSLGGRLAGAGADLSLLAPRRNAQGALHVGKGVAESVEIGGTRVPATRLAVAPAGSAPTDVWVDGSGRVLKVSIPSRGVVALRDDPPSR